MDKLIYITYVNGVTDTLIQQNIVTLYRRKRPYGFIHWKMTMWVLHNRPNGCKMEDFPPLGTVFAPILSFFFMDEPIGSFSPVQGDCYIIFQNQIYVSASKSSPLALTGPHGQLASTIIVLTLKRILCTSLVFMKGSGSLLFQCLWLLLLSSFTRVCIIINGGMPWYDDVHHHLLIYDHTGPVKLRSSIPAVKGSEFWVGRCLARNRYAPP